MNKYHYIINNYNQLLLNIEQTAIACSRNPEEIKLVAVTKTVGIEEISLLIENGVKAIGENRVKDYLEKKKLIHSNVQWHFIGHLQRNKVRNIVGTSALIHSVDSLRLLQRIDDEAANKNVKQAILLEVNTSDESSKYGLAPSELEEICRVASSLQNVTVEGLMTMAPFTENVDVIRNCFRELAQLKISINTIKIPGILLTQLSMGMTNDYKIAIEQGATLIRVGTALFKQS